MSSMMGAMSQQGGAQSFGNLMAAGQQLASQMQEQNPELVEQFRRQFQGGSTASDNEQPPNQNGNRYLKCFYVDFCFTGPEQPPPSS